MEIKLSEIKEFSKLKVISQISLVKDKILFYEQKYGMNFSDFEVKIKSDNNENSDEWDDYIEWKAYDHTLQSLYQEIKEIENVKDITVLKE